MFDDAESAARARRRFACIRLNDEHREWCRAVLLTEAMGGRRDLSAAGTVYWFPTEVARDETLRILRGRFGAWIAESVDRGP